MHVKTGYFTWSVNLHYYISVTVSDLDLTLSGASERVKTALR